MKFVLNLCDFNIRNARVRAVLLIKLTKAGRLGLPLAVIAVAIGPLSL